MLKGAILGFGVLLLSFLVYAGAATIGEALGLTGWLLHAAAGAAAVINLGMTAKSL